VTVPQRDGATIPPLRGPTRQKAARKRKSGRSGRNDNFWGSVGGGYAAPTALLIVVGTEPSPHGLG